MISPEFAEALGEAENRIVSRVVNELSKLLKGTRPEPTAGGSGGFVTVREAGVMLRKSDITIRKYIRAGKLDAVKPVPGGRVLIKKDSVLRLFR